MHPSRFDAYQLRIAESSSLAHFSLLRIALYCARELTLSTIAATARLHLPELVTAGDLQLAGDRIRSELELLGRELIKVEDEITVLNTTIHGLTLILGPESFDSRHLSTERPAPRRHVRGLTQGCRFILRNAVSPCSVSAICTLVTALNPELLIHHRNPLASITSALRTLASRGHVMRSIENGKSVWQWMPPSRLPFREALQLENECVLDQATQSGGVSTAA